MKQRACTTASSRIPTRQRVTPSALTAFASLLLTLGTGLNALAQYPSAPPGTPPTAPTISFVPRPIDPLGFDIPLADLGIPHSPDALGTEPDTNQPIPLQDVLGPDGSPIPGHPQFAGFGALFNNTAFSGPTPILIRSFQLFFDTPLDIDTIAVDTFYRSDDLQSFQSPGGTPGLISTWDHSISSTTSGGKRHWHIIFNADSDNVFNWVPVGLGGTPPNYEAFTFLASQFPLDSDIQFTYLPGTQRVSTVPEPGAVALTLTLLTAGIGLRLRRRR